MIDLYYWTTPNGHKITIFIEETGLASRVLLLGDAESPGDICNLTRNEIRRRVISFPRSRARNSRRGVSGAKGSKPRR